MAFLVGNAGSGSRQTPVRGRDRRRWRAGAVSVDRAGGVPEPGCADACRQFQHHAAVESGVGVHRRRQDRQGHELPRPDDLQQRRLLHQGQRRQRRQHGLLHRHDRQGLPEHERHARCRRAAAGRAAAERSDRLQPGDHSDAGCVSLQHVHPRRLPDRAGGRDERGVLPVRDLVCERGHDLPRRRGQRRQHLRPDDQHVHRRRRRHDGGAAEVGLQWDNVAARLYAAERPEPGRPLHRGRVPDR